MDRKKQIKTLSIILIIGAIYYIFVVATGLAIPCIFRKITGLKCPGCGITTMFLDIAKLDISGAFYANPFIFVTFPLLVAEILYVYFNKKKEGRLYNANRVFQAIYISALLIFAVIRNLV